MKKCIDKAAIENILHKLWKEDTGYEYVDIARIAYNRALQDVQCEMDALEVQEEHVNIWHDASVKPNIKEKGGIVVITSLNGEYIGSRYYSHNDVTITFGNYDKWAYLNDLVNLSNVERTVKDRKEETVSEDLEEAAKERVDAEDYGYVDEDGMPLYDSGYLEYMFKAGAKWQFAKIKSITLDDLGEFINELSKQFPEVSFAKVCKIATRTAKWLLNIELPKLEED